MHGGEDYELLFAAPASVLMPTSLAGVPITRIGTLKTTALRSTLMTMLAPDGSRAELKPGGWEHFSGIRKSAEEEITLTLLPSIGSALKPTSRNLCATPPKSFVPR